MLLMIDNYDSFTYNLYHFLGELGAVVEVWRNDALSVEDALAKRPAGIILSPGPCDPDRAGICLELVRAARDVCPILGVCLGHQTIAQAFGGHIERAPTVMHGKLSAVQHDGSGVFSGLANPLTATRYHSLVARPTELPQDLVANAHTEDGVIMGIRHLSLPIHGVQFHPESIASERGHALLDNFLDICADPQRGKRLFDPKTDRVATGRMPIKGAA